MDDAVVIGFFIILLGFGGWVLGIVGFFRAERANRELRHLAARLRERPAEYAPPIPQTPAASLPVVELPPVEAPPPPEPPPIPEPELPPVEEIAVARAEPATPRLDFETLVTQRLGVWIGAVALLCAGGFLVGYAVDQGLLGPAMRCSLAALLGLGLVAGGEFMRRRAVETTSPLADHAPPALAAGGVAVLFGAAYGFGPFYDLVPPLVGFVLLACAALAGLALSLVQGPLVAAVGIAGAYATPALVQTNDPSLPGLFAYLFAVTAASLGVVRYTAWTWLGWAATIAASLWVLIAADMATTANVWAPALFIPAVALLDLAFLPAAALEQRVGRYLAWIPFAALGLVGLVLVDSVDDALPKIGLLLLGPVAVWAGRRHPALDRLPWLASLLTLLLLAIWILPPWQPTGEKIMADGEIRAVLPGDWTPEAIRPFLLTSLGIAAFFGLAGFWQERSAPNRLRWTALPATVPVLVLALAYARVEHFQPAPSWALIAALLTGLLVGGATLARRAGDLQRAGIHGAGAVAALALGFGMILTDHWLSMAIALILPALAWIESRTDLRALRHVALAVAGLVLVRLLANWYVLDYAFGRFPIVNGLIVAYLIPAIAFALAAQMFSRRGDDLAVAVLRGGSAALATAFVTAEIHHWATAGQLGNASADFLEQALHVDALALLSLATMRINRGLDTPVLRWAWRIQGGLALFGAAILLLWNPAFTGAWVGRAVIVDPILAAYALPAVLAIAVRRQKEAGEAKLVPLLTIIALVAGFAWISLEIRHLFHRNEMDLDSIPIRTAELWAYSGGWMAYGIALLTVGIRLRSQMIRFAALAMLGLVTVKVFLVDMSGLEGLWRVLSFLGLGLTLIGLGAVYRRFVGIASGPA